MTTDLMCLGVPLLVLGLFGILTLTAYIDDWQASRNDKRKRGTDE